MDGSAAGCLTCTLLGAPNIPYLDELEVQSHRGHHLGRMKSGLVGPRDFSRG